MVSGSEPCGAPSPFWTRMNRTFPIGSRCGANPVSSGQRRHRKAVCRQYRPACARERSSSPHNRRRYRGRPRDAPLGIPPNLCGTAIPWSSRLPSGYYLASVVLRLGPPVKPVAQRWGVVLSRLLRRRPLLEEGPCLSVDPTMSVNRTVEERCRCRVAGARHYRRRGSLRSRMGARVWLRQAAAGGRRHRGSALRLLRPARVSSRPRAPSERGSPTGVQPFEMLRARSRMETMPTSVPPSMTGRCRNPPSSILSIASPTVASGPIVRGFRVVPFDTGDTRAGSARNCSKAKRMWRPPRSSSSTAPP